jgi:hypothetical protein
MQLFLQRLSECLGISQNRGKTHEPRHHRHRKRLRRCTRRGTARICVRYYEQIGAMSHLLLHGMSTLLTRNGPVGSV